MATREARRKPWTVWHVVLAAAAVGVSVLITSNAWSDLLNIGLHDEESSHVLLVPMVMAWLVWIRRVRLRGATPHGRYIGAILIGLGWMLWSAGYRHQIQSFWHAGAVVMAVGALLTVVGVDILFAFLPAFAVLVFVVPIPSTGRQYLALPLQQVTAQMTQGMAEMVGITMNLHGNLLTVNGQEVAIAEACNGLRMVFTLFLACYTFAFVTPLRGYVRFLVLAASPVIAIACNVLRLVPTVWMFGHTSVDTAEMFHDASGWAMLVLAFLGLMGIVRVLRWAMLPVAPFRLVGVA